MNPLKQLEECGQSPWLDFVRRSLIERGEIAVLVERDGLKGMTSNPSIFEKGIGETEEYNEVFENFVREADRGVGEIYEHLAVHDIQGAADALRPVYDATRGRDGYISLEVSPYLARDAEATIAEAHRLARAVSRPNLMVKVPATPECIPAIRRLLADGLSINITLLFSVDAYEQVAEAYIAGLEERAKAGQDVANIASVASFFVSRIDSAIDKAIDAQLKKGGDKQALDALRGKVAIANAKRAYQLYLKMFSGPRWEALAAKGAHTQRLLWASTSTKNPSYRDVIYVEELIGRDTVNTLPPATMDAFRDHGVIKRDAIEQGVDEAERVLTSLQPAGISLADVTRELVDDGVRQFADSFDGLLGAVARRRRERLEPHGAHQQIAAGEIADKLTAEQETWRKAGNIRRLWAGDASLWTGGDEAKWLGWLSIPDTEMAGIEALKRFGELQVKEAGVKHVVLLGMGGSSLGPEVLAETLKPVSAGWPRFHMLDSTDPAQVRALDRAIDVASSKFIVSSKSGSTLEPNIFRDYFLARAREALGDKAGAAFVAVTDPGSSMEKAAHADRFAEVFFGDKAIGGRYSVLSKFGLVPGAAIGLDLSKLLASAQGMSRACAPEVPPAQNPGVQLGLLLGVAARDAGRDKVTILAGQGIESLGAWLEQLLAESTGKQGRGLIPIDAEPLVDAGAYGKDRVFAYLHLDGRHDDAKARLADALEKAGHPVVRILVPEPEDIGAEFFRWEIATAVAGAVIGIDPFDQPDVEASKIKTRALTDEYEQSGKLPEEAPIFRENGIALYTDERNAQALGRHNTLEAALRAHLQRAGQGDYVALLAYLERNEAHTEALQAIRRRILERRRCATALGFGPRFLHSTGQAYKGGPPSGVFLQITTDDAEDLPIPGHRFSFGVVKAAQARGDFGVLAERGRRALRVHLSSTEPGLAALARAIDRALD